MRKAAFVFRIFLGIALTFNFLSCSGEGSEENTSVLPDAPPPATKYKCSNCNTEYDTENEKNNCAVESGCPKYVPETDTIIELVKNPYDGSNATYKGIQGKLNLRTAENPFTGLQAGETYVLTLKGTSTASINPQILLWDSKANSGSGQNLTDWGVNQQFNTTFTITKEFNLTAVPSTADALSFQLMIDLPAGSSATSDVSPVTLTIKEFSLVKKGNSPSGPEITDWTLVNDFDSSTIAAGWNCGNWAIGDMFYCGWKPDHITFNENNNGLMRIKMDNTKFSDSIPYTSGEFRTNNTYGYGYYEVRMKPCKYSGTNSSFFLYTEETSNGTRTAWNEIDIEFLGKDTSIVQFNYYIDPNGEGHEYVCDLKQLMNDPNFDASEDFHTYGIEYAPAYIKWYVDGVLAYTATGCDENHSGHTKNALPTRNMQIMTNFWPGKGVDEWLGTFTYTKPLYAEYDYIKFKAAE